MKKYYREVTVMPLEEHKPLVKMARKTGKAKSRIIRDALIEHLKDN